MPVGHLQARYRAPALEHQGQGPVQEGLRALALGAAGQHPAAYRGAVPSGWCRATEPVGRLEGSYLQPTPAEWYRVTRWE